MKIRVSNNNGLQVNVLEGQNMLDKGDDAITVDNSKISMILTNSPVFKINKIDSNTKLPIANTKFAIYKITYNEDGTSKKEPAKDALGNIIGTEENINGTNYYAVTTNENGEITAGLSEGLYCIEEIQPAEGYEIQENNKTYTFRIGDTKPKGESYKIAKKVDWEEESYFYNIKEVSDGYIVIGSTYKDFSITDFRGKTTNIPAGSSFILKYNKSFENIMWVNNVETYASNIYIGKNNEYIIKANEYISKYSKDGKLIKLIDLTDIMKKLNFRSMRIQKDMVQDDLRYMIIGKLEEGESANISTENGDRIVTKGEFILELNDDLEIYDYTNINSSEYANKLKKYNKGKIKNINYSNVGWFDSETEVTTQQQGNVKLKNSGIFVCDEDGNYIWATSLSSESIKLIDSARLPDGGAIAIGNEYKAETITVNGKEQNLTTGNIVMKFDKNGNLVYVLNSTDNELFATNSIIDSDGRYIVLSAKRVNDEESGKLLYAGIRVVSNENIDAEIPEKSEITIENTKKQYKITTEVKQGKGTISGQDSNPYETVEYKKDSKLPIIAVPESGWKVKRITINNQIVEFTTSDDGSVTLPQFTEMTEDKHIAVWFVNPTDEYNYEVTKTDENGNPLSGAKFTIKEPGWEKSDALDENGLPIGNYEVINGKMMAVVTSDSYGKIRLNLQPGKYELEEVQAPDGYMLPVSVSERIKKIVIPVYEINYIEDLLDFASLASSGKTYENELVVLCRDLDFNDDSSYRNPDSKYYGDYNGDKKTEGIKAELTNENGTGFKGISQFSGSFNGNGYSIKNLYSKHNNKSVGFFKYLNGDGYIKNLKLENVNIYVNIDTLRSNTCFDIGVIAEDSFHTNIENCYVSGNLKLDTDTTASIYVGGIVGFTSADIINTFSKLNINFKGERSNDFEIGGIAGHSNGKILNSGNEGNIEENSTGISSSFRRVINGIAQQNECSIINCYNTGNIQTNSCKVYGISGTNCYNRGNIKGATIIGLGEDSKNSYTTSATCRGEYNYYLKEDDDSDNAKSEAEMKSQEFVNLLNENIKKIDSDEELLQWKYKENDYPYLDIKYNENIEQEYPKNIQTVTIKNEEFKYKITTEIGINSERTRSGGTITGDYDAKYCNSSSEYFVETVKPGESNNTDIIIKPNDDYKIISITINGEDLNYVVDSDGSYIIPKGYFSNMQEDKHIIVIFEKADQVLTINKSDFSDANKMLPNAQFKIEQLDERPEVTNEIGELTASGEYYGELKVGEKDNSVIGDLVNDGVRYFVKNGDSYVPNTLEMATGNAYASSHLKLDLSDKKNQYLLKINVMNGDGGDFHSRLTKANSTSSYFFIDIVGHSDANDYTQIMNGGQVYDLYLQQYGYSNCVVNSIDVYKLENKNELIGELVNTNEKYYFEKDDDGNYIPKYTKITSMDDLIESQKTMGYFEIDLTNKEGFYQIISNTPWGGSTIWGYISDSSERVEYQDISDEAFVTPYAENPIKMGIYSSKVLEGGKKYYFHVGALQDVSQQKITINLYEVDAQKYSFEERDGKYVSNNKNKNETIASSYIPIDLSNRTGKYDLNISATISAETWDRGYVILTKSQKLPEDPEDSRSDGMIIEMYGGAYSKTKSKTITAGDMYYLHFLYIKNSCSSEGEDEFSIDKVELSLSKEDIYNDTITTNNFGQIKQKVPIGKYKITEVKAPEGYALDGTTIDYNVEEGKDNTLTITNKKITDIIVHHYLKNTDGTYTTIPVAPDETQSKPVGEQYTTSPKTDLTDVTLEKNENNEYVIPQNATGEFKAETQEITYYYEPKDITLTVHHYLEGTSTSLKDDEKYSYAPIVSIDNQNNTYKITANAEFDIDQNKNYNDLINNYNFVNVVTDIKEGATIDETLHFDKNSEVTYYYNTKGHTITTQVKKHTENRTDSLTNEKAEVQVEGGTITGDYNEKYPEQNSIKYIETVKQNENSTQTIIAKPDENYTVKQIKLQSTNDSGIKTETIIYGKDAVDNAEINATKDDNGNVTLTTFTNVTENKHIIVEFEPAMGTVIVHHYIEGTGEEYGNTAVKVPSKDGNVVENEVKNDYVGEVYSTKESNNVANIYELKSVSGKISGRYINGELNVYYYYNYRSYNYSIHYYYDGVEKVSNAITDQKATYGTVITDYPDKAEGYVFEKVTPAGDGNKTKLTITENEEQNRINVYYRSQFKITTDVIEHSEVYKNGDKKESVKGGEISGEDEAPYEKVFKGDIPQKEIKITPSRTTDDQGNTVEYEVVKIVIKNSKDDTTGVEVDITKLSKEDDGSVILPKEYLTDGNNGMQSDKHIEVEFRKKSNVIIKYLEKDTENVLYKTSDGKDYEEITGYEGEHFETSRKAITNYKTAESNSITDDIKEAMNKYNGVETNDKTYVNGTMYADTLTIIYWYEKISSGIIVKHIEIDESDIKDGLTLNKGKILDEETVPGYVGELTNTVRKNYENMISVNGPESTNENLIIVGKDENNKNVTCKENNAIEVRYYYEKQYNVTTEVKPHDEKIFNNQTNEYETKKVDGGTISKEYITSEDGSKVETIYEKINKMGYNKKKIEIIPDDGYRIKEITINGIKYDINQLQKDGDKVIITSGTDDNDEKAFFKDVNEDKHVIVEFERIPARVIVEYKDAYTKENIDKIDTKIINGYVNDKYNETRPDIEGYVPVDPEPTNSSGKMTKEDITIVYWYNKEYKITTDVIEMKLVDKEGNIITKKGGTISGEDEIPYETVLRGNNNKKAIEIIPDYGFEIKQIKINGVSIDYINDNGMIKDGKNVRIPDEYFKNMQENKHIEVEFKRIPGKIIVKNLEDGTDKPLTEDTTGSGYIGEKYKTQPSDIKYYELVEEKYPNNSEGELSEEETVVIYYYRKIKFNFKIEKEISKIVVNNKEQALESEMPIITLEYKDVSDTTIKVEYKIKVTNTEKLAGKAIIEENIPDGFEFAEENADEWNLVDGKYVLETELINPGESKEYVVVLKWKNDTQNKGKKVNNVKIIDTQNEANFDETTLEDNEDNAVVELKIDKTVNDVIDDIKNGNSKEIIRDIKTAVKTGDTIIVSVVVLTVSTISLIIIVKRKSKK